METNQYSLALWAFEFVLGKNLMDRMQTLHAVNRNYNHVYFDF